MLPSDNESPGKIVVKDNFLPSKEFEALFRIIALTKVVLDERVIAQNAIPGMILIASADQATLTCARRTLYE